MKTLCTIESTEAGLFTLEDLDGELYLQHRWSEGDPAPTTIPVEVDLLERLLRTARRATPIMVREQNVIQFPRPASANLAAFWTEVFDPRTLIPATPWPDSLFDNVDVGGD